MAGIPLKLLFDGIHRPILQQTDYLLYENLLKQMAYYAEETIDSSYTT